MLCSQRYFVLINKITLIFLQWYIHNCLQYFTLALLAVHHLIRAASCCVPPPPPPQLPPLTVAKAGSNHYGQR